MLFDAALILAMAHSATACTVASTVTVWNPPAMLEAPTVVDDDDDDDDDSSLLHITQALLSMPYPLLHSQPATQWKVLQKSVCVALHVAAAHTRGQSFQ